MNDIPAPIPSTYKIRPATEHDMPQINGIVNHEIAVSVNNFNYGPRSEQDGLAWFRATIAGGYPIFVATSTVEGGAEEVVAGYSSLGSFRQKDGYRL
jgi:phosphinothricin acetyltransferase